MVDKVVVVYNIAVSPSYTVHCIWSNRTQCHHQLAISTIFLLASKLCCLGTTTIRGGVEDTRLEAKAKDTKKNRGQGQGQPFRGQTLSRPRTGMLAAKAKDTSVSALQNHKNFFGDLKKKKSLHKNFSSGIHKKNVFQKIFQALHKILAIQKILLSSSRGQANFRGLEASRPRPRTSKSVLEDVLEAKDVLEDSTYDHYNKI